MNRVARTAARVHLVGAGPGDPELLTLKAVRAIRQATVLLVDDLVGEGVLRYARRSARIVHVGKRGGCASTPQAFIERLMVAEARRGERVVRLKGGDPFVFGRGGEEAARLRAAGIEVEVVNGITAGLAAATSIGVPLTHRDHAHGVVFVTGHARRDAAGAAIDWPTLAAAAAQGLTLVIYMGIATVEALQSGLCGALAAGHAGRRGAERQPADAASGVLHPRHPGRDGRERGPRQPVDHRRRRRRPGGAARLGFRRRKPAAPRRP